ncbi:MAG: hypothetical protein QM636_09630 [Rhizobium sp.]
MTSLLPLARMSGRVAALAACLFVTANLDAARAETPSNAWKAYGGGINVLG